MKPEDMTAVQRHNMTCPYCGLLTEHGSALDAHLRAVHGISDRDVLTRIYRHQVTTAPNVSAATPEPLPPLPTSATDELGSSPKDVCSGGSDGTGKEPGA